MLAGGDKVEKQRINKVSEGKILRYHLYSINVYGLLELPLVMMVDENDNNCSWFHMANCYIFQCGLTLEIFI